MLSFPKFLKNCTPKAMSLIFFNTVYYIQVDANTSKCFGQDVIQYICCFYDIFTSLEVFSHKAGIICLFEFIFSGF